ncbi:MAG: hypothetical protein HDS81_01150 [Bacteroidales bacterium]|nr:hypothetical protein [Bacteroidales bacterium]
MHVAEQKFATFLRSRPASLLLIVAGLVMTLAAPMLGLIPVLPDAGTSSALIEFPFSLSVPSWATVLMLLAVTAMMFHINRRYNLLRTTRIVYAGFFMLMCGAAPAPPTETVMSTLLAMVLLVSLALYYLLYNRPRDRRKVFLTGVILGSAVLLHRATILYLPVLILGLTQMRIFSSRSLAALIIGLLTPAWIAWAIFDVSFNFHISVWRESPFVYFRHPSLWPAVASVVLTLLAGFVMGFMVLIKVLTLNARARALNGLLTLMAVASGIFIIADFENLFFYLTALNCFVAFQIAHFFRLNRHRSSYISVTILIIAYTAIYVCPLIL